MRIELLVVVVVVVVMGNMVLEVNSRWIPQPFKKYHVKVVNQLGNNRPLKVQCKFGDEDKGLHNLAGGQAYEFGFHIKFFGTTVCTCEFWDDKQQHSAFTTFDSNERFAISQCGGNWCIWEPRDDGFYLLNTETDKFVWKHPWGKK
ncbi:S-protein homolog 2-like [Carica papaya]|uniref:S-protein homolog 2-like n=1 Tax=Carica papaya TaxID=3649 RepID=UPI000B8CC07D|nr:S-protein homolog 2-like [Carica papaya]